MEKVNQKALIGIRFRQIRDDLYEGKNRKMGFEIGEDEGVISSICGGTRPIGLTTILKLVNANSAVDATWLLTGRIPRADSKPYAAEEESAPLIAAEEPEPYPYGRPKADYVPWSRYDAAQQEIGALRTRLEQSAESVARLLKENSELRKKPVSPLPATPEAPTFV